MNAKRLLVPIVLVTLAVVGCGTRRPIEDRPQDKAQVDRKLSTWAFIDEGKLTTFIVDTYATRWREDEAYIPIEIAVANSGVRHLRMSRESFILIDEEGNRYPVASPHELLEGYPFLDLDRTRMAELGAIVHNKFGAYTRYQSQFSPTDMSAQPLVLDDLNQVYTGPSGVVRDVVSLPKFGYLLDFIYFPTPSTGVKGRRFELFFSSPDLQDPVFVKFEVK